MLQILFSHILSCFLHVHLDLYKNLVFLFFSPPSFLAFPSFSYCVCLASTLSSVLFPPHALFRHSTLRALATRSSRSPPSLWIQTRPSQCLMWCPISVNCLTLATLTALEYLGMPWWKEMTLPSPLLLSVPPLRD